MGQELGEGGGPCSRSKGVTDLSADMMPMDTLVLPTSLWVPATTTVGMLVPTMLCC